MGCLRAFPRRFRDLEDDGLDGSRPTKPCACAISSWRRRLTMCGESNWFEGVWLLALYSVLAMAFLFSSLGRHRSAAWPPGGCARRGRGSGGITSAAASSHEPGTQWGGEARPPGGRAELAA